MLAAPELWGCAHTILRRLLQGISVIVSVHDAYCRGSRVSIVGTGDSKRNIFLVGVGWLAAWRARALHGGGLVILGSVHFGAAWGLRSG
jgi:hypothetical protein